jgi:hypothetical protein
MIILKARLFFWRESGIFWQRKMIIRQTLEFSGLLSAINQIAGSF